MAARALRGLWAPRFLAACFSQRAAAGTEFRSAYSLDKLYPPRDGGTASDPASGNGVASGWDWAEPGPGAQRGLCAVTCGGQRQARGAREAAPPPRSSPDAASPPLPSCFPGGGQASGPQHPRG